MAEYSPREQAIYDTAVDDILQEISELLLETATFMERDTKLMLKSAEKMGAPECVADIVQATSGMSIDRVLTALKSVQVRRATVESTYVPTKH